MGRRPPALAVLAVLLAVVAACSGDDDPTVEGRRSTSTTSPSTTSTTAPPTTSTTNPAEEVAAGRCPAPPARNRPDRRRPRYVVRMDVDPAAGVVEGDLTVRFTPDRAVDRLVFRLWPNGPRPAAAGVRLDPGPVTIGGHEVATARPDPTTLEVRLASRLAAGRSIDVSVPWRLTVPGPVKDRISRNGDALRLGTFLPLLAWEPGVGWATEPPTSGFAEATTSPVADWSLSVGVPAGYGVLASGVPDGNGRWRAEAVRDVALSVGRFTTAEATANAPDPVKVTVGVHAGTGAAPGPFLDKVVRSLEQFAARYGPYPWPVYTLAITPDLSGGIEFPMHVMQGPTTIGRTTSHEVAHMWFYGLVGNNQGRDPWLDEALASWAEAQFEGTLDEFRASDIPSAGRGRAGEPMTYWEPNQTAYYRSVYVQGAVALGEAGPPEAVDCALRHYAARHAHRIARPADLLAILDALLPGASGRMAPFGLHA